MSNASPSPMPIRILHVFGRMNRGGAEMRTLDIMRHIDREKYRLEYCSLSGLRGDLDDEIATLDGVTHLCKLDFKFPIRFVQLLRRERFDVVHSHVHYSSGLILLLARFGGVGTRIAHFRTTGNGTSRQKFRRIRNSMLRWLINRNATRILAVSRGAMVANLGQHWQDDPRCSVTYSGVDVEKYSVPADRLGVRREFALDQLTQLIIHVGRMDPPKNHRRLLTIFAAIAESDPACFLLMVGRNDSILQQELFARAETLHLSNRIAFAGLRTDIPRLLLASDLLLFPSLWEGLPGVLLEATAAGIPVLASDTPGALEISQRIPSVHTLPLSLPDRVWSDLAISLLQSTTDATETLAALKNSVFSAENVARVHTSAWTGSL